MTRRTGEWQQRESRGVRPNGEGLWRNVSMHWQRLIHLHCSTTASLLLCESLRLTECRQHKREVGKQDGWRAAEERDVRGVIQIARREHTNPYTCYKIPFSIGLLTFSCSAVAARLFQVYVYITKE